MAPKITAPSCCASVALHGGASSPDASENKKKEWDDCRFAITDRELKKSLIFLSAHERSAPIPDKQRR